jgi:hypothetical protein
LDDTAEVWQLVKALYGKAIEPRKLDVFGLLSRGLSSTSEEEESSSDEKSKNDPYVISKPTSFSIPPWNLSKAIYSLLDYHLESGDIQLCVSIGIVLGSRVNLPNLHEWKSAYSNLLRKFGLFTQATELAFDVYIKL